MNRHALWWPFLGALLLGLLAAPAPAGARSVVVYSEPADGAVLPQAPEALQLWFDGAAIVEPGAVTLTDAGGAALAIPSTHSDIYRPDDAGLAELFDSTFLFLCSLGLSSYPTRLTVHLPSLGPGTYRLSWRAIAVDDRRASSGTLVFAVDPAAPAADMPESLAGSFTSVSDDLMLTMTVRPNRPGASFISLQAAPVRRPLRAPVEGATLVLTPPGGAPREVALEPAGDGRLLASGDLIDRPGRWSAELRVARGALPDTVARIVWDVPAGRAAPPLWAAAIGGLALAGLLAAVWRARREGQGG